MKQAGHLIDGVLLLDKPAGLSSNDALQRARRLLNAAKAGHGGTLDPLATGLLPLAFGEATKFLHDLLDADKTYEAVVQLGTATDSGDAEGVVIRTSPVEQDDAAIRHACAAFAGPILQVPPMHSALKRDGRPLYELARAGGHVELEPRAVTVHALEVRAIDRADPVAPRVDMRVTVSKGTYIRALARDIGERLGCGAHLAGLRRTAVDGLSIAQAVTLAQLEALAPADRIAALAPLDALVAGLPRVELGDELATRFMHGQRIVLDAAVRHAVAAHEAGRVRVYRARHLLGVAEFRPPGLLAPLRLVAQRAAPNP